MEPIRLNFLVEGGDLIGAGEASSKMKLALKKLDLPAEVIRRCAICMYEGEINMVIHANGGRAEVEISMDHVIIRMVDSGPGIPDLARAMEPGRRRGGPGPRLRRRHGPAQHEALLRRNGGGIHRGGGYHRHHADQFLSVAFWEVAI